jgi:acyl carrier protein
MMATGFKLKIKEGEVSNKLYDEVSQLIYRTVEEESPELSRNIGATLEQSGSFMESLQVDSLLALEIVSRIEKRFGIQFQEEDFVHFDTMENIVSLVDRKIREKNNKKIGSTNKVTSRVKSRQIEERSKLPTKKKVKSKRKISPTPKTPNKKGKMPTKRVKRKKVG